MSMSWKFIIGKIFRGKTKTVGGCSVSGTNYSVMALAICTWLEMFLTVINMDVDFADVLTQNLFNSLFVKQERGVQLQTWNGFCDWNDVKSVSNRVASL